MTIEGFGVLSSAGSTTDELAARFERACTGADQPSELGRLEEFNVRDELGRKGTSFFDRRTSLTIVATKRAFENTTLDADNQPTNLGMVLGTTVGSMKSSVDYATETFTEDPPYMVNPALFPNTVMNCSAGQAAIWFGLRGINTTIAGGAPAFLSSLHYAANAFRRNQAAALLVGAVEEYTEHTTWAWRGRESTHPQSEGAAIFVLRPETPKNASTAQARILSTACGFSRNGADRTASVQRLLNGVLEQAGVDATEVSVVLTDLDDGPPVNDTIIGELGGHEDIRHVRARQVAGDCQAAALPIALASLQSARATRSAVDVEVAVLLGQTAAGALSAAVIEMRGHGDDRS